MCGAGRRVVWHEARPNAYRMRRAIHVGICTLRGLSRYSQRRPNKDGAEVGACSGLPAAVHTRGLSRSDSHTVRVPESPLISRHTVPHAHPSADGLWCISGACSDLPSALPHFVSLCTLFSRLHHTGSRGWKLHACTRGVRARMKVRIRSESGHNRPCSSDSETTAR